LTELSSELVVSDRSIGERSRRLVLGGSFRYVAEVLLLGGLYYGSARVGYELNFAGPVAAIVWLPVGVGIAYLYLRGISLWPGVLIGDLLANNYTAVPVGSAFGQTCGNVLEVVVAAYLMRRLVRVGSPLSTVRGVSCMLLSIVAGTTLSATVGNLSLLPTAALNGPEFPGVWRTWWLGDTTGALVLVPLAIAWLKPFDLRPRETRRMVEAACLFAVSAGLAELAFDQSGPLTYLVFPALIWAALRFGPRGGTLAVSVVVCLALWNTTHYGGPFAYHDVGHTVLSVQLYVAVAALSTLFLAAAVSERERFANGLAASLARLVDASDTERRRLEHNLHDGAQQRLTALALKLQAGIENVHERPDRAESLLVDAAVELQSAIGELRELAHGMHPAALTTFGFSAAVRDLTARSPVPAELLELPGGRFDRVAEATAYYLVAEAVTNSQRHAHATSIRIRARLERDVLYVEVVDDGIGGADEELGSGLVGLRDRVAGRGGRFDVESAPGLGTRISAWIPVADGLDDGTIRSG
jgi:signal transduction histidine kinase